jgi:hypothetical protein
VQLALSHPILDGKMMLSFGIVQGSYLYIVEIFVLFLKKMPNVETSGKPYNQNKQQLH